MSILKEQAVNEHHTGVILPFWHEKQGEIYNLKKTRGQFCEHIRTKWTGFIRRWAGFIRRRTSFIRRRTSFIRRPDEASPPEDEASPPQMKPVLLVLILFSFFFLFSNVFFCCLQQEFYHQNQRLKSLFLRTYVDLLNYPFRRYFRT